MFETPHIVHHGMVDDNPDQHKEPGLDDCVEIPCEVPANCFAHYAEDRTPSDVAKASVRSQCDGYCDHAITDEYPS